MAAINKLFIGNLTADPDLRYTQSGIPVVNFTVAETPRSFDKETNQWKDGETLFMRATAWRDLAEHIAASFQKGSRVIAYGELKQKKFQDREGNDRVSIELSIEDIGASVRYGTIAYTRAQSSQGGYADGWATQTPQGQHPPQQASTGQGDPWAVVGSQAQQTQAPQQQAPQPQQVEPQAQQGAMFPASAGAWNTPSGFSDDTPF